LNKSKPSLPIGKLPQDLLNRILALAPDLDERILLGPGIGMDCAVVDLGERLLVLKSDPITFVAQEIGWYAVQVCANDMATTAARPRWFLPTLLLPQGRTTEELVIAISRQISDACRQLGISVVGGHTEITHALERPVVVGTLIGEVEPGRLVTPCGAAPGNRLLLTKGVPIEGTAILAREFSSRLTADFTAKEIERAAGFLYDPGISVVRDACLALEVGGVTAMHDPTEGGLVTALWEIAWASGCAVLFEPERVHVPSLSRRFCGKFNMDPLATIASGALLIAAQAEFAGEICRVLEAQGIRCVDIGCLESGPPRVWYNGDSGRQELPCPSKDEITKAFE
jgi:hydrogenase expression/formation protein HypE